MGPSGLQRAPSQMKSGLLFSFHIFGGLGRLEVGKVLACVPPSPFLAPGTSPPSPSHPDLCLAALPGPTTASHHVIPSLAPALVLECLLACCGQGGRDSLCQSF